MNKNMIVGMLLCILSMAFIIWIGKDSEAPNWLITFGALASGGLFLLNGWVQSLKSDSENEGDEHA